MKFSKWLCSVRIEGFFPCAFFPYQILFLIAYYWSLAAREHAQLCWWYWILYQLLPITNGAQNNFCSFSYKTNSFLLSIPFLMILRVSNISTSYLKYGFQRNKQYETKLPCATPCPTVASDSILLLVFKESWKHGLALGLHSNITLSGQMLWYVHHNKQNMNKNSLGRKDYSVFCVLYGQQRIWQVPFGAGGALQQQGFYETSWHDFLIWNPKYSSQFCAHQCCSEGWDCPAEFVFTSDDIKLIYTMFLIFLCTETHKRLSLHPS